MHSGLVDPADKTEAVSLCEFFLDNCRLDEMEEDSEEHSENFINLINKYASYVMVFSKNVPKLIKT